MGEITVQQYIVNTFAGVETAESFGYTLFFVGSDRKLPFATIAASDNPYDQVSNLDRPGVYRLNIGVGRATFAALFGGAKVDLSAYDFSALDTIMPHPDYAPQHFVCVLNPSEATFARLEPLLAEAYELALRRAARSHHR